MIKVLDGGTFNLKYGRDKNTVKGEVERLLHKHHLDFLVVQESTDYRRELGDIKGYDYIYNQDVGILTKHTVKQDKVKSNDYGDGWTTVRGGHHTPTGAIQVRLNDWLYVRTGHMPTPTTWVNGKLVSPDERKDDYIAAAKGLLRYFNWPCTRYGRIAAADWNESPDTIGEYSPGKIARDKGAKTWTPESRVGHGRIDWVMGKGVKVTKIFKDLDIKEGSDHEPVIFTVSKA